ncbi:MAG: ABC transporter transmembrane domain-containing protein [Alphaproteobacteria bacterium]
MEKSLYGSIWRYNRGYQLVILAVTIASFPLLYYALELPKVIVNNALGSKGAGGPFPREYFGIGFDQLEYLLTLCALFFVLLIINGGITVSLFIFKGITSERLLRRLRYTLFERIHRFPVKHFQKTSQGELTSMITAKVEPFSQFFADAVELPLFQGGTMLTVLLFVFIQDPIMGFASISIIPLQAYIIPKLQKKVNLLAKERVVRIRNVAGRISEAVSGINDIHTHDTALFTLSDFTNHLGGVFRVRMSIYQNKAVLKFLNNFLLKLTPLLFYSVGGILILNGELDIGQLVAVLGAYSQMMQPWKELLKFYQRLMDAKIKYQQVTEQFDPADMIPENLMLVDRPEAIEQSTKAITLSNVTVTDDDDVKSLEGVSFEAAPGSRVALVAAGSGRDSLANVLTGRIRPTQGSVQMGGVDVSRMHEAVIGKTIGYAGPDSYVFDETILYNSYFGMRHAPISTAGTGDEKALSEAVSSGNSPHEVTANWIDPQDAGAKNELELRAWWLHAARAVELKDFLYGRAMSMAVNPERHPNLVSGVLEGRKRVMKELRDSPELGGLIYPFDAQAYNVSASVGANMIFGEALSEEFATANLGRHPRIRALLEEVRLTSKFQEIGLKLAVTIVEVFDGMEAGDPLFEKFNFVDEESMVELKRIFLSMQHDGDVSELAEEDISLLISLPFHLVAEKHRLGHINAVMQTRILEARRLFQETLSDGERQAIAFFDVDEYNPCLSLRSNLIMGRVSASKPNAEEQVDDILHRILDELGLEADMVLAGADFEVGIAGRRIPLAARQSLVLLRSILKRPAVLVLNESLSAHNRATRDIIRRNLEDLLPNSTLIWIDSEVPEEGTFDRVYNICDGRLVLDGMEAVVVESTESEATEDEQVAAIAALRQTTFFADAAASQLKLIAFACDRVSFTSGEEIFRQGDDADAAYVVLDGRVDTYVGSGEQEVQVSQTVEGNQLIGEMALLSTRSRVVTARATTAATLLRLETDMFLQLVDGDLEFSGRISRILSDRIYSMTERMQEAA